MDPVQNLQNRLTDQPASYNAPVLCQPKLMFGRAKLRSGLETVQTELVRATPTPIHFQTECAILAVSTNITLKWI